jgi:hypothetical protein
MYWGPSEVVAVTTAAAGGVSRELGMQLFQNCEHERSNRSSRGCGEETEDHHFHSARVSAPQSKD